ncbi:autotransporter domain-containing protein [Comamonas sp. 17RB]|uniref:autotransporter domain-containing protein n=1 Tax=Comamonas sp. 17RB TaxID=3047025 RepID=UPI0024B75D58|nr:autotransporter domain-containing protein [Comamonas sp. 17RB]MDI9853845.1 autotransporter domain-containing protein [Comamonas sp. 17RB]
MNRIYRSIWNATLGAWVAAPETARMGGGSGRSTVGSEAGGGAAASTRMLSGWHGIAGAIAVAWGLMAATPAYAACVLVFPNVNCSAATIGNQSFANSNLTFTVATGGTITPTSSVTPVVNLTGTGVTVNNNGRIDPALLANLSAVTTGVRISNAAGSTVTVRNNLTGVLMGSTLTLPGGLLSSLDGNALALENGAGGTSTLLNDGTIGGNVLLGLPVQLEDVPVIAMRGGARNIVTNTGTITGRVALQAVSIGATGNTFTNSGTINGSVNLGAGGYSNSFYASTGSSVNKGSGVALDLPGIISLGITYAATGFVDGGTLNNSTNGGNTLYLQLNPDGTKPTTGSINGSQYLNFNNLVVTGGTWSLTNQLFSNSATTRNVLLSGGQLNVDSAALTGASITANGGALGAATTGAVVASGITLGTLGLTVNNSTNDLTLNGLITGSGALTKTGTGTLTLGAANDFTSTTTLAGGTINLGNAAGLSNQALNVTGASTLATTGAMTVANAIGLNGANLTVDNTGATTLSGVISGTGSLTKSSSSGDLTLSNANSFGGGLISNGGKLTLSGANTIAGGLAINAGNVTLEADNDVSGGVFINGGKLTLGDQGSIGAGNTITTGVAGTAALDTTSDQTLGSQIQLNGNLTLAGSSDLTLQGKVSGPGGLIKNGTATLTLSGANDFTGSVDVNGGRLVSTVATGLGASGQVNIASGATVELQDGGTIGRLNGYGDVDLVAGTLKLAGGSFHGILSGDGHLDKVDTGTLRLTGNNNSLAGNTSVSDGTLRVDGSLGSGNVTVHSGGTLAGGGVLGGAVTVEDGGHLSLSSGSGLSLFSISPLSVSYGSTLHMAALTLNANSHVDAELGVASTTALANVTGNLVLDGSLNITDAGGFGLGVYRLFDYGGSLTDNGLELGNLPAGVDLVDLEVQTSVDKQVNLVVGGTSTVRFWDGAGSTNDGSIAGGSGVWNSNNTNWSIASGNFNGAWNESFAVFQGTAGTVTVEGTQRVTGLQFVSDGYQLVGGSGSPGGQLELVGNVSGDAIIRVDPGVTATLDVALSGSATLAKVDSGTLVLNGNNSYTGGTRLDGGTLEVGHNSALGSGALQVHGAGTLQSNTDVTLGNAVALDADLTLAGSHDLTLGGAISGAGNLIKSGTGTVTLTGANSATGGTLITAGRLVASSGSLSRGAIINNAALELHQTSDGTLAQAISGSGSFTKTGAGTLTLAGVNTSTGDTTISAGSLVASVANLASGAITNNAALELKQASDATLAQTISGSGTVSKTGAGVLTLSATNTYSGGTSINAGTLVAANNSALGTGHVTVGNAAALEVASGTTLAVGSLDFQAGSTYRVNVDPDSGASGRIDVAGTATLAGSVLHVGTVSDATTDFQVGKTYTILHAGQVDGTFSAAASNYAYLDVGLGYLKTNEVTTDVTLTLERNDTAFASLAQTPNQASAARGIESLPRTHQLYQYVQKLANGAPAAVFASLSGEVQASVGSSLVGLGTYAPSVSGQHLRNNMTAGFRAGAPVAQSDGPLPASAWPSSKALPAWAEVVGHWQRYDGDGNAAQLKQRTTGLFLGMDQEVGTSGWRLGGSVGYTNADGRVADRSSESDVNSYSAAVYGGKSFGTGTGPRINVLGGLAYTWHDIETTRRVSSLGQTLKADYSAHTAQLFAEVGYAIGQYDKVGFEPFAGVSLGQQRTGSFQERGGFAALKGRSSTDDLASTTLGMRVHSDFQLAGKEGRLRATVGWRHAFGDVTAKKTMAFEGGQNFTVAGTPLARNTAVLGLEADVALSRTAALVLGYQGELGSGQRDHSASVKLRWAF